MGVQFPGKKRYVTLEWPLSYDVQKITFGAILKKMFRKPLTSVFWGNGNSARSQEPMI